MQESTMLRNDEIFELLYRFPAMFTGESTLASIQQFLTGYGFALKHHGIPTTDDALILPQAFPEWVAYRLHFRESTLGWCKMICTRMASDRDAIDAFFRLLAEFKERKPHTVAKLIGFRNTFSQSSSDRYVSGEFKLPEFVARSYPNSMSLVTYTDDPGFFAYSDAEEPIRGDRFYPDLESFELHLGADRSMLTILDPTWNPGPSTHK